jgi:hypothetical protein
LFARHLPVVAVAGLFVIVVWFVAGLLVIACWPLLPFACCCCQFACCLLGWLPLSLAIAAGCCRFGFVVAACCRLLLAAVAVAGFGCCRLRHCLLLLLVSLPVCCWFVVVWLLVAGCCRLHCLLLSLPVVTFSCLIAGCCSLLVVCWLSVVALLVIALVVIAAVTVVAVAGCLLPLLLFAVLLVVRHCSSFGSRHRFGSSFCRSLLSVTFTVHCLVCLRQVCSSLSLPVWSLLRLVVSCSSVRSLSVVNCQFRLSLAGCLPSLAVAGCQFAVSRLSVTAGTVVWVVGCLLLARFAAASSLSVVITAKSLFVACRHRLLSCCRHSIGVAAWLFRRSGAHCWRCRLAAVVAGGGSARWRLVARLFVLGWRCRWRRVAALSAALGACRRHRLSFV